MYNWSVGFKPSSNRNALSQRDILMTWLSVRTLDRSVRGITSNRISLNNSLVCPLYIKILHKIFFK